MAMNMSNILALKYQCLTAASELKILQSVSFKLIIETFCKLSTSIWLLKLLLTKFMWRNFLSDAVSETGTTAYKIFFFCVSRYFKPISDKKISIISLFSFNALVPNKWRQIWKSFFHVLSFLINVITKHFLVTSSDVLVAKVTGIFQNLPKYQFWRFEL